MTTFNSLNNPRTFSQNYSYSPLNIEKSDLIRLVLRLLSMAFIGSVLGFAGMQINNAHAVSSFSEFRVAAGLQTMSAIELTRSIQATGKTVYWLGDRQVNSFSNNTLTTGLDQISYRQGELGELPINQFQVIVKTYQSAVDHDRRLHPLLSGEERTITLSNGASLTYNQDSTDKATVKFSDKPQVVELQYPTSQPLPILINDAASLVTIA